MPRITPMLWFDTQSQEAAEFYCSVFPNSKITATSYYTEAGPREAGTVLTVNFQLDGHEFIALNGGPHFSFDEAISFVIQARDQAEVDYYWEKLTDGGQESQCGWLKDRFGVSWQVVPEGFEKAMTNPDEQARTRAMKALLGMRKIDLAAIEAAASAVRA